MDGELFSEVAQGIKAVAGIEAFLVLAEAAFHLAVMAGGEGRMNLWRIPRSAAAASNRVGRSHLLLENWFAN